MPHPGQTPCTEKSASSPSWSTTDRLRLPGHHVGCERRLGAGGPCRHPDHARPSMSGYGIDVSRLMNAAGWRMSWITRTTSAEEVPMGALVGMVLLG